MWVGGEQNGSTTLNNTGHGELWYSQEGVTK